MKVKKLLAGILSAAMMITAVNPAAALERKVTYVQEASSVKEKLPTPDAYYDFDEDLSNKVSENSYPGQISGNGVERVSDNGFEGGALKFTKEANSYFSVKDAINAAEDDFTLSAWVKLDENYHTGNNKTYLFQQTGDGKSILFLDSNGKYDTFLAGAAFPATAENEVIEDPLSWHMVTVSWDANDKKMDLYINGKPHVSNTFSTSAHNGKTDLWVGAHKQGAQTDAFKGMVDELSFYLEALTAAQVKELYDSYEDTAARLYYPAAYFTFDEDLNNTVSDNTASDNTVSNNTVSNNASEHKLYTGSITGAGVQRVDDQGIKGGSLHFTKQEGSYFKVEKALDASKEKFTLTAWVKYEEEYRSGTENVHVFQQGEPGRSILFLDKDNKYDTFLTGAEFAQTVENTALEAPASYHMVSVSWDPDTKEMKVYVNGALQVEGTFTSQAQSGIADLILGAHKNGNQSNAMKGYIDELLIHKEVLTAEQIQSIFDYYEYTPETGTDSEPEPEPEPEDENLVAFFDFEGGIENKAENAALSGEIVGTGVTYEENAGIQGGGLKFTKQASSHFKVGNSINAANNDFTLSAWVKYEDGYMDGSNTISLFQQNGTGRALLFLNSSNQYGTYIHGSNSVSSKAVGAGLWHLAVMTWDASEKQIKIYVNGEQVHEAKLEGSISTDTTDLLVGGHKDNSQAAAIKGSLDELRVYDKVLTLEEVKEIFDVYKEHEDLKPLEPKPAENLKISLNPDVVVRDIPGAMFGINHRYHNDGYGTWLTEEDKIAPAFDAYAKEASFGSIRYPGGTVSNLFEWKKTIGPVEDRKKTINGSNFYDNVGQVPIAPNFGVDEAMTWIVDDMDAEVIWVYGMGKGSAQDAADLIEYLNAPADGDATNPNGGTDWAEIRKENGHEEPYNVTRFELGNEVGQWGQTYWMDGRNGRGIIDAYINGGTMTFGTGTKTVLEEDWRTAAANSDGTPNQVKYTYYAPLTEGTVEVLVGGTKYEIVDTLEGQGAANVCTVDYATGRITFGDGVNGNIPAKGQQITAGYSTEQDGFIAIYDAMKGVAEEIGIEIDILAGIEDKNSFINTMHNSGNDDKYDGIAIHPYSGSFGDAGAADFYENSLARTLYNNVTRVESLKETMKKVSGEDKIVAVSEFGIYNYSHPYVKSHGHAIYIANEMIYYVNLGAEYLNKHCLVDFVSGAGTGGDSLGPAGQCVIQSVPQADGTYRYVSTPSARMFSIFNEMSGTSQIENEVTGNGIFHVYSGTLTVPTVNFITTKDEAGNAYVIAVNNAREATEVEIQIERDDISDNTADIWYITTDNERNENTLEDPDKIAVEKTTEEITGNTITYTLEPMSVTGVRIPYTQAQEGGNEEGEDVTYEAPVITGNLTKVYDGKPADTSLLSVDVKGQPLEAVFAFYSDVSGNELTKAPEDAGTYYVKAFFLPEGETEAVVESNMLTFEILPAPLTVSGADVAVVQEENGAKLEVKDVSFSGLQQGETLIYGVDYTATVSGNVEVPVTTAEVSIKLNNTEKADNYILETGIWKEELHAIRLGHENIWVMGLKDLVYTGQKQTPNIVVYDGEKKLTEKTDYTITYKNNLNVYTLGEKENDFNKKKAPQLVIKMKGNYKDSYTLFFKILPVSLEDESIILDPVSATFTGKAQTPQVSVLWEGKKLKANKDYIVKKESGETNLKKAFTAAGSYVLVVEGKGNYEGKKNISYTISQKTEEVALADVSIKKIQTQNFAAGEAVIPAVEVKYKNKPLQQTEYILTFEKNDAAGTAYAVLDGTGTDGDGDGITFIGRKRISFKIAGTEMSKVKAEGISKSYPFKGEVIEPLKDGSTGKVVGPKGEELISGKDYTVTYEKNESKGTAVMILKGNPESGYTGTKKVTFKITAAAFNEKDFKLTFQGVSGNDAETPKLPFTKGGVKPAIEVSTKEGTLLEEGKDYTISYKNNKALTSKTGKQGEVIVKGKGNYSGTLSETFEIVVKDTAVFENSVKIIAADKVATTKKNGWKASIKVVDSDGKVLSKQDYDASTLVYTVKEVSGNDASVKKGDVLADQSSYTLPVGTVIDVTLTLKGNYKGTVSTTYRILDQGYDISKATIKIKPQSYTGFAVEIDENTDFQVAELKVQGVKYPLYLEAGDQQNIKVVEDSYEKNVKKGTAKVTFEGVGKFGGRKTVTFKIGQRSILDFFNDVFDDWNWIFN